MNSPKQPIPEQSGRLRRIHAGLRIKLSQRLYPAAQLAAVLRGGVEFFGRPGDDWGGLDVPVLAGP